MSICGSSHYVWGFSLCRSPALMILSFNNRMKFNVQRFYRQPHRSVFLSYVNKPTNTNWLSAAPCSISLAGLDRVSL